MPEKIKKHGGTIYIAAMTAVLAIILLCTDEWEKIAEAVRQMRPGWIAAALGCVAVYLMLRMATIVFYLRRRGAALTWRDAAAVTGAGQFYSAITPSASGGQPMQVLELHRRGVPVSLGTACVSVKFIGFQTAVLVTGGVLWAVNRSMVAQQLYGFRWLVALGFAVNAALLAAIAIGVSHMHLLHGLIRRCVGFGARLRMVKKPDAACEKLFGVLEDYRDALLSILQAPIDMIVILAMSFLQVLAYMSIIICAYRAFDLAGTGSMQLLTLQYLLFVAAAFVPLPGAAGAQEGGFCVFFRNVFPDGCLSAAMICWRLFSYYLLMIVGFALTAAGEIGKKRL